MEFYQFMIIYETICTKLGICFVPPVYTEAEQCIQYYIVYSTNSTKIQYYKPDHFYLIWGIPPLYIKFSL